MAIKIKHENTSSSMMIIILFMFSLNLSLKTDAENNITFPSFLYIQYTLREKEVQEEIKNKATLEKAEKCHLSCKLKRETTRKKENGKRETSMTTTSS